MLHSHTNHLDLPCVLRVVYICRPTAVCFVDRILLTFLSGDYFSVLVRALIVFSVLFVVCRTLCGLYGS